MDTLDLDSLPIPTSTKDLEQLLRIQRGIEEKDWKRFFFPEYPMNLQADAYFESATLKKAVELVRKHSKQNSTIVIFGDYDVDGICATAVLWEALDAAGIRATPFLPNRFTHGYGLTKQAVEAILGFEKRPDLLITVDTGISAVDAVARLQSEGIEVLLTDHHQVGEDGVPSAEVVLHNTSLCGTTVSWFFAREFSRSVAENALDLCALATMGDQVPHREANRSFARHGVDSLKQTRRLGLTALLEAVGLKQRFLDGRSAQFKLIPPLNAFGRMDDPLDGLRLVCARNPQKARELARRSVELNLTRQTRSMEMSQIAKQRLSEQLGDLAVLVDDSFHEGLIGLVAGRVVEQYRKPAIVIAPSQSDDRVLKGSVRSIPGVHVVELLQPFSAILVEYGGHEMAGGFSVAREDLDALVDGLRAVRIGDDLLFSDSRNEADGFPLCRLSPELLIPESLELLEQLEPFGQANPQPRFLIEDVRVISTAPLGKNPEHRKLTVTVGADLEMDLLEFGRSRLPNLDDQSEEARLAVVCTLQGRAGRPVGIVSGGYFLET